MENSMTTDSQIESQPINSVLDVEVSHSGAILEAMAAAAPVSTKRERTNAKPVDALDLDGNLIGSYKSGSLASQALNVQQGDISLCCRGLKHSIMGYRFRFAGETEDRHEMAKLKKGFGFVLEGEAKPEITRSTRASRGDYGQVVKIEVEKKPLLAPADVKSRAWEKTPVIVGPFKILKWLPRDQPNPTPALQDLLPKPSEAKAKAKYNAKRKSYTRPSVGSSTRQSIGSVGGGAVSYRDSYGAGGNNDANYDEF